MVFMECIFCKIIKKEIPAKLLYEDETAVVFPDIHPVRAVHLLVVPKVHVEDFVKVDDAEFFAKLFSIAQQMVGREGLRDRGFRIVINGGGAQIVPHLHIHLMGPIGKTTSLGL
jgi:histidine triad (HIT) family protein